MHNLEYPRGVGVGLPPLFFRRADTALWENLSFQRAGARTPINQHFLKETLINS